MAALDEVWQQLALEFDGQDLRLPELRAKADDIWSKLGALLVELKGPKRLPAPNKAAIDSLRQKIDAAFGFFRLVD